VCVYAHVYVCVRVYACVSVCFFGLCVCVCLCVCGVYTHVHIQMYSAGRNDTQDLREIFEDVASISDKEATLQVECCSVS